MRWTTNTTTMRERSRRLSAAKLQLAVGRRGLGPRGQEEQRTQRASFVAMYHTRVHTAAAAATATGHRAGLGCMVLQKYHVKRHGTSLRGQTRVVSAQASMLESRTERSAHAAAPDIAVVDVGLNSLSPKT